MRFALAIGLALALVTGPLCANAQDDPTPDTQAALDTVRAALDDFAQAETYSGQITQTIEQVVTITYLGETVALTQHMKLEGTVVVQQAPGQSAANRQIDFVQSMRRSRRSHRDRSGRIPCTGRGQPVLPARGGR